MASSVCSRSKKKLYLRNRLDGHSHPPSVVPRLSSRSAHALQLAGSPLDSPSPSLRMSDRKTRRGRSASLHLPKRSDPTPIPPSLANSPHLLSPYSIFRRKSVVPKSPSKEHDEWLGDMVPLGWEKGIHAEQVSSRSAAAISVPVSDASQGNSPSSSTGSSLQSVDVASQRHHVHRPWSSPSTPYLIPIDMTRSDSSDAQDARV